MTLFSKSGNGSQPPPKAPMKLQHVFLLGFLFSLLVIAASIYLFAAYEVGRWMPWLHEPHISQVRLFEIVRNAVTTAAALGVGVTLFFSYRRQQTAEAAQVLATEAQSVAAQALNLATQQHIDELAKRQDDRVRTLRERFSTYAEHLSGNQVALSIAATHSLEALADEWHSLGYDQERQNCVSLMCSILRMGKRTEDNFQVRSFIYQTVMNRLRKGLPEGVYWPVRVDLSYRAERHQRDLFLDGADLICRGITPDTEDESTLDRVEIRRGSLDLTQLDLSRESMYIRDSVFAGGNLRLGTDEYSHDGSVIFRNCRFAGTDLIVPTESTSSLTLAFEDCVFEGGALRISRIGLPKQIKLARCSVQSDFFEPTNPEVGTAYVALSVDADTTFGEGIRRLATRTRSLRPQFNWETEEEYLKHPALPPQPASPPVWESEVMPTDAPGMAL